MKSYRFSLNCLEAEKMWDFSMNNDVIFHFITKTEEVDFNIISVSSRRYVYDGIMDEETFLMFKLAIPSMTEK